VTTILHKRAERRPLATPAQLKALDGLIDAANGDATPCRDRPAWWGTEPPRAAKARAAWYAERKAMCDACPVLAQCKTLVGTGMRVDGVTAGDYYDDGRLIKDPSAVGTANARRAAQAAVKRDRAIRLRADGATDRDIARALKVTTTAVRRYLQAAS